MFLQFEQHLFCYSLQCIEYALARHRHRLKPCYAVGIKYCIHLRRGRDIRQIPFVILNDEGQFFEFISLLREIDFQVVEALHIGLHALNLGIRNEDHAVDAFQDQLSACRIKDLSGNGIEVKSYPETLNISERNGKKIEKK